MYSKVRQSELRCGIPILSEGRLFRVMLGYGASDIGREPQHIEYFWLCATF
jgi:hypothetical protein